MNSQRSVQRSESDHARTESQWPLLDAIAQELRELRGAARPTDIRTARKLLGSAFRDACPAHAALHPRAHFGRRMAG
jgi:hypothetical protein